MRKLAFILFFCGMPVTAWAQMASVRGLVLDVSSHQPMAGATIALQNSEGSWFGTISDANGFFAVVGLMPDTYRLSVSFVGYETETRVLSVNFNDLMRLNVLIRPAETQAGHVEVSAQASDGVPAVQGAGLTTLRPGDLSIFPTISGSKDLAALIETVPGFVAPSDRGGQLYVRGGTPTQNLILMDGIPIYQPFHMVSGFSAFPEDLITQGDVYSGGFGARYGGRIASVMDISTRNGNKQRFEAAASLDPMLTGARLEGPLWRGKISFLGSYRTSLLDRLPADWSRPFAFTDAFAKIHTYLSATSSWSIIGLRTTDAGSLDGKSLLDQRISWTNEALGTRFIYLPPSFPALLDLNIAGTRLHSTYGAPMNPSRFANVEGYHSSFNFDYLLPKWEPRFGMFMRSYRFAYQLAETQNEAEFTTEVGLYFDAKVPIRNRWILESGYRLHAFPSQGITSSEPRLRLAWHPNGTASGNVIHAAWGRYHQQIIGVQDGSDIGEVFLAWAPAVYSTPTATHYILGQSRQITSNLRITNEAYYKTLQQLTVRERGESFARADGTAMGLDTQLHWRNRRFQTMIAYSLASVTYQTTNFRFNPAHDRRHQLHAVASWFIGAFRVSMKWQFGSGFPYTQVEGFAFTSPILPDKSDHLTNPGTYLPQFGPPFTQRFPAYNRVDLGSEWIWKRPHVNGICFVGIQNVLQRNNIFYYDLYADTRVDQYGLFPTAGLRIELK